jgi:lipopolysaccharide transport system permease protein
MANLDNRAEVVIEPGFSGRKYWHDLWRYRELLVIFGWRDIAVRYKQTLIGIAWAALRPLLTMAAFTLVFSRLAGLPSDGGVPYPLMVFAAMLPWYFFSSALTGASESLVENANLVSKVYFPRLLVPAAAIGVAAVDFAVALGVMFVLMLLYQFQPSIQILAVLPLTLLTGILALGPGLVLCALNVTYRDFRYVVPFATQFGLYVSPVGFSSSIVPGHFRFLFELNPMVGIIDGFRWALLGASEFPARSLAVSVLAAILLLYLGLGRFRAAERRFADVI